MLIRIAVLDPLPAYRRGILATLGDAGFAAESPADLLDWAAADERRLVLLTLGAPEDWHLLTRIRRARPGTEVLALLDDPSVPSYVRALTGGAVGAVPRNAPTDLVREVFEAAVRGRSLLPIEVLRALSAGTAAPSSDAETVSSREVGWLRLLAGGATVARLADQAGYSERMMFRLLRVVYAKLGATSRTEALMTARTRGLL